MRESISESYPLWLVCKVKEEGGEKKGRKIEASFIHSFNKNLLSIFSLHSPELSGGNRRTNRTVSVFKIIFCPESSNGKQRRKSYQKIVEMASAN